MQETGAEEGKRDEELARLERKVGRGAGGGRGNGWALTEKSRWKERERRGERR